MTHALINPIRRGTLQGVPRAFPRRTADAALPVERPTRLDRLTFEIDRARVERSAVFQDDAAVRGVTVTGEGQRCSVGVVPRDQDA